MSRPHLGFRATPRSFLRLLLAVCAVVALGAGAFLADTQLIHKSSHASEHAVVAAAKGHPEAGAASATPSVHDVLFVGASYTAGLGASPATEGYAYVIGRQPGWQAQVNGVAGTGFLNPGPHGDQTFAQRIVHMPTHPRPDLVVFQGGRNDVNYPAAQLRAAAIQTAALTRKRFSGVQIVFLGPIPARVPAPDDQIAVAATLRSAAAACKCVFVNPIEQAWITPGNEQGYLGPVPAHPDNDGYAYIAQRLLSDLELLYPNHGNA
jgi:lysophospholipase L1-like esterase